MKKGVTFKNGVLKMAGVLHTPENFDENKKYAAIVCVHPGGGVKEQTAGLYAQKLSEQGFITLAFDASCQGESEGEPRGFENPTDRVEDIRCAIDYLTTLPFIDKDKLGALGICAGGGYVVNASATERRIKAVAGISSVDIGALFAEGIDGNNPVSEQLKTLESVANQRTAEANGAERLYIPWAPNSPDEFTENMPVLFKEAYDYYRTTRGKHPNSDNKMLFVSIDKLMAFRAFDRIPNYLTHPLLMIAGNVADTRQYSELAVELSNGPKELFLVEDASHIDMYDIPKYVNQAVEKLTEFFSKNLK